MKLAWIVAAALSVAATGPSAAAETYTVRVVRDVPYLQAARYADNKDKLDIYLPEGRRNVPVIVSYYGNQLMAGIRARTPTSDNDLQRPVLRLLS